MTAGLPGTGIGSLFYVLLTVWMPFSELFALAQGRSSWKRWRLIAMQWAMLSAIIVGIWYFTELLLWAYVCLRTWLDSSFVMETNTGLMAYVSLIGGMVTLTLVLTAMFVLRSIQRVKRSRQAIVSASRPLAGLQATLAPTGSLREPVSTTV
ncbi:MAG: hypothetical protein PHU85_11415 [Phycisphaerae bacterium]|nr:hypothetical protein [Phycisphaerae bacterium]